MARFKEGDRVQVVGSHPNNIAHGLFDGTVGTITKFNKNLEGKHGEYHITFENGVSTTGWKDTGDLELLNKRTIMKTLNIMMKKLLDGDTQTLVKAGYVNGDLELTSEGRDALNSIAFDAHKAALVALAQEKLDEEKAK